MTRTDCSDLPFLHRLGAAIRHRRKLAGLTVQELGDLAGVSRRLLTDLELGRTNSSLATVDRIARALGTDFPTLVALERGSVRPISVPHRPVEVWSNERGSRAILNVTGSRPNSPELWQWRLAAGDSYVSDADPSGFEELFLVLEGSLRLSADAQVVDLAPGQAARLASDRVCLLTAVGETPMLAVSALLPRAG